MSISFFWSVLNSKCVLHAKQFNNVYGFLAKSDQCMEIRIQLVETYTYLQLVWLLKQVQLCILCSNGMDVWVQLFFRSAYVLSCIKCRSASSSWFYNSMQNSLFDLKSSNNCHLYICIFVFKTILGSAIQQYSEVLISSVKLVLGCCVKVSTFMWACFGRMS